MTTPLDPRTAQMQLSAQDTQDSARRIDALKKNLTPPKDKEKKLREACEGFESIFIQKMWEQMRATVPKSGLLKGREEQFWQGMFDQELSKKMSSAGGIGLADMMYDQLSRNLLSATRTTASGLAQKAEGFTVSPAPLLPQDSPKGVQATAEARTTNMAQATVTAQNIYSGEAVQPEGDGASKHIPAQSPAVAPAAAPGTTAPASDAQPVAGAQPAAGQAGAAEQTQPPTSPIVEQFLAELRAKQHIAQQGPTPQPAVAGQNAAVPGTATPGAPRQSAAPQSMPTPVATAQNVMQTAGSRMPAGGVLPPMPPIQRQPRVERHQGSPAVSQSNVNVPAAPGTTTPPVAGAVAAAQAPTAPSVTTPPATGQTPSAQPAAGQMQATQENTAVPPTPQIVHTTFTTNVPPTKGARRRPPRVPKGQALNRMPAQTAAPQQTLQPQQGQQPQTAALRQSPAAVPTAAAQTSAAASGNGAPRG